MAFRLRGSLNKVTRDSVRKAVGSFQNPRKGAKCKTNKRTPETKEQSKKAGQGAGKRKGEEEEKDEEEEEQEDEEARSKEERWDKKKRAK